MSNTTTILTIMVAVLIITLFPLMIDANRKNDITTKSVQEATTEFTTQARTIGKITREAYDNFIYTLEATGESYEVDITVQRIDENYAKKANKNGGGTTIGDNVYLTEYNTQVMDGLNTDNVYKLYGGDIITINVKNTSKTIAEQIKNIFYNIKLDNSPAIVASASGLVLGGNLGMAAGLSDSEGENPTGPGETTIGNGDIEITLPPEVKAGDRIRVVLTVTGDEDNAIKGIQAKINYNPDVFELLKDEANVLIDNWGKDITQIENTNEFMVEPSDLMDTTKYIKDKKDVIEFWFQVKDNAESGTETIGQCATYICDRCR